MGREQFYALSIDDQVDRIAYVRARNQLEGLFVESRTMEPRVKDEDPEDINRRALEKHQERMRKHG